LVVVSSDVERGHLMIGRAAPNLGGPPDWGKGPGAGVVSCNGLVLFGG